MRIRANLFVRVASKSCLFQLRAQPWTYINETLRHAQAAIIDLQDCWNAVPTR